MFKRKIITKEPASKEKAYEYAVYLLSLSLRTSGEMENKLKEKGYAQETIHKVIEELKTARYVDDRRYAEVYLENLKKYKTFGYYGIKKKLMEKRLPQNIIERVLNEGLGEEEELKIAKRFLKKHEAGSVYKTKKTLPGFEEDAKQEAKQKLAQKFRARGFRNSIIVKLLSGNSF